MFLIPLRHGLLSLGVPLFLQQLSLAFALGGGETLSLGFRRKKLALSLYCRLPSLLRSRLGWLH